VGADALIEKEDAMTLFDEATRAEHTVRVLWTPQEAVIGVLVTAMRADNEFAEDEAQALRQTLRRMKLFRDLDEAEISGLVSRMMAYQTRHPLADAVMSAARAVPLSLRRTVFAQATELVLVDGQARTEERQYLDRLAAALELEAADARRIIEVLITKNSG
jgi:tellurite resistance protein